MRILLSGNISSGKGTLIKGVLPHLEDYEHLAIDDYREKYGDRTEEGETLARQQFLFDIKWNENCLIECTGIGVLYRMIKPFVDHNFLLRTSNQICFDRFQKRGTNAVLPSNWFKDIDLMSSLKYIEICHGRTKYKQVFLNNDKKNILIFKAKVKNLR